VSALLELRRLVKRFAWRHPVWRWRRVELRAVEGVDLDVERGECLALVGESGSGKTTLGRAMLRLIEPDSGSVHFDGEDLLALEPEALRRRRRDFQMVFQDAASALDPRFRIGEILAEPLRLHEELGARQMAERCAELLAAVGLSTELSERYPHQLSGGQRQRLGIARALATKPRLLVLDEPVSALDVSVRAQIVNLLAELRRRFELTMVMIAHDLSVVETLSDRVAVLYLGRIVEVASRREIFEAPQHPYTAGLLASVPVPDPLRRRQGQPLAGEVPSPLDPPPGCPFHPRCPIAHERCRRERPELVTLAPGRQVACHEPGGWQPGSEEVESRFDNAEVRPRGRNISGDPT